MDEFLPTSLARPIIACMDRPGGDAEHYEHATALARQNGFPPPGMLVHLAGEAPGSWFTASVWESQADAESFFAGALGDALVAAAAEDGAAIDATYAMAPLVGLEIGEELSNRDEREVGNADAEVAICFTSAAMNADVYLQARAEASFPETLPDGLLMHAAAIFHGSWRVFDLWRDQGCARRHYEQFDSRPLRLDPGDADIGALPRHQFTRIDVHTLNAVDGVLGRLSSHSIGREEIASLPPTEERQLHFDAEEARDLDVLVRALSV